jgi:hypothetical protein
MLNSAVREAWRPGTANQASPGRRRVSNRPPAASNSGWSTRFLSMARWYRLLSLFLTTVAISAGFGDTASQRILLPVEVLGANGTTESRTFVLKPEQADSVRSLWLHVHRLRYADEGSVQVNASTWVPLNNTTVIVAEPGKSYGGIGGGFATLTMTFPLPKGSVHAGTNTIRFRFNQTDGFASGYRVLAWNLVTADGSKVIPADAFVEDNPDMWTPPLADAASIRAGKDLWDHASLIANSLPDSPRIQAHCADCHVQDGRDLKYFNFSNHSIVMRSRFHGLSTTQGEQIASYIRSLPLPNPGRPWNPPYQPGPGLDEQAVSHWAAGAGLVWVLDRDVEALPHLLAQSSDPSNKQPPSIPLNSRELARQITPDIFRPDGNLNPRQIPISLQLPDWSEWLPRVHPKDAWGAAFTRSAFAALYDGSPTSTFAGKLGAKPSLRQLLATQGSNQDAARIVPAFARWSQSRRSFFRHVLKARTAWSAALTNQVYSTQLWQLVKTWEMMQEFSLEGRGRELFGPAATTRAWCNTIPLETAPAVANIPDGPAGVGGSALTNEYATAAWYELQIVLNSGNHQHRDRSPIDWVYVTGRFLDLYDRTQQPDPVRLLVNVIKALQSTAPNLRPDDLRQGWRPDDNIDPRIMVSPQWAPIFKPLPPEVRRAVTSSLLTAWLDKNQQYSVAEFLPIGLREYPYRGGHAYDEISGGRVWDAAPQFLNAGVSPDLVERLERWGLAYTDRAARIQYSGGVSH